jgi:hypothetical protein
MALEQLDYWEAQVRKTSQLETTGLLGSTSKRYITSLIIFKKNMNMTNKNITSLD